MMWIAACKWLLTIGIVAGISVEFPNPQKEFRLCGRRNASFICDPEFILDIADADRLNQLAASFRKSTKCLCPGCEEGISVGIFIKSNLTEETMKKYPSGRSLAEMLRKRWHLGKCNDDIIIILLKEMNISDYSLGPAVQKIFPEETAELILKDCRDHFLFGWYYQGLESVVISFNDALMKLQKEKKTSSKSLITGLSLGIGVLLILIILAILLLRRQNKRRKRGCSDIYKSVSSEMNHENFLKGKMKKQNFKILNKSQDSDEEDEESEDDTNTMSQQFLQIRRHLSAVVEESEDHETLKDSTSFIKDIYSPQRKNHSLQVTEL